MSQLMAVIKIPPVLKIVRKYQRAKFQAISLM